MLPEEFIRCPNCDGGYFKKETTLILDKANFERKPPVYEPLEEITSYTCTSCDKLLGETTSYN